MILALIQSNNLIQFYIYLQILLTVLPLSILMIQLNVSAFKFHHQPFIPYKAIQSSCYHMNTLFKNSRPQIKEKIFKLVQPIIHTDELSMAL